MLEFPFRFMNELELRFPDGIDVLLFDADGTLFDIEYDSWFFLTRNLAEQFNLGMSSDEAVKRHSEIYEEYLESVKKQVPDAYSSMVTQLMALWTRNGNVKITKENIIEICRKIPLRDSLTSIVQEAHTHGVRIGILTASFSIVSDVMAEKLGLQLEGADLRQLDFVAANTELLFDEDGYFSGFDQNALFDVFKVVQLQKLVQKYSFSVLKLLPFGDGSTDVELFEMLCSRYKLSQNNSLNHLPNESEILSDFRRGIMVNSNHPELAPFAFAKLVSFKEFLDVFKAYQEILRARSLVERPRQSI